jgi:hypothetical protein
VLDPDCLQVARVQVQELEAGRGDLNGLDRAASARPGESVGPGLQTIVDIWVTARPTGAGPGGRGRLSGRAAIPAGWRLIPPRG